MSYQIKCDRCGMTIYGWTLPDSWAEIREEGYETEHLCTECRKALEEWIDGYGDAS